MQALISLSHLPPPSFPPFSPPPPPSLPPPPPPPPPPPSPEPHVSHCPKPSGQLLAYQGQHTTSNRMFPQSSPHLLRPSRPSPQLSTGTLQPKVPPGCNISHSGRSTKRWRNTKRRRFISGRVCRRTRVCMWPRCT